MTAHNIDDKRGLRSSVGRWAARIPILGSQGPAILPKCRMQLQASRTRKAFNQRTIPPQLPPSPARITSRYVGRDHVINLNSIADGNGLWAHPILHLDASARYRLRQTAQSALMHDRNALIVYYCTSCRYLFVWCSDSLVALKPSIPVPVPGCWVLGR